MSPIDTMTWTAHARAYLASIAVLAIIGCAGPDGGRDAAQASPAPASADQNTLSSAPAPSYNVVMIAVDDLNIYVGGPWGGPAVTPNIDRLAASGTAFINAHAVVPACAPSRAALMTGQRPERTGAYRNEHHFRAIADNHRLVTLPQRLRQESYVAVAAGKIFHNPRGLESEPNPRSDPASWDEQARTPTGTPGHDRFLDEDGWAGVA